MDEAKSISSDGQDPAIKRAILIIGSALDQANASPIVAVLALSDVLSAAMEMGMGLGYPTHVEDNRQTMLRVVDELREHIATCEIKPKEEPRIIMPGSKTIS